jgi:hypothetical protein
MVFVGWIGGVLLVRVEGAYDGVRGSVQAIGAGSEEFEEFEVAEDLELLADFVGDVGVFGMEFG